MGWVWKLIPDKVHLSPFELLSGFAVKKGQTDISVLPERALRKEKTSPRTYCMSISRNVVLLCSLSFSLVNDLWDGMRDDPTTNGVPNWPHPPPFFSFSFFHRSFFYPLQFSISLLGSALSFSFLPPLLPSPLIFITLSSSLIFIILFPPPNFSSVCVNAMTAMQL